MKSNMILSALFTELKKVFVKLILVDVSVVPVDFPLLSTGAG